MAASRSSYQAMSRRHHDQRQSGTSSLFIPIHVALQVALTYFSAPTIATLVSDSSPESLSFFLGGIALFYSTSPTYAPEYPILRQIFYLEANWVR